MPLIHSGSPEALHENMRTLMHDVGKSPHVQSRKQAIAIALSNARRYGRAAGGGVPSPFGERMAARQIYHEGFLHSNVPGRTDKLPITVAGGSYVVPSQHLAAIGQDNSLAGASILDRMFKMGPYGTGKTGLHSAKAQAPRLSLKVSGQHLASGGVPEGEPIDIIAAGGEYVIPPQAIIDRFGSLEAGHKALDEWITSTRPKHAKTIAKLAPPRKD